MELGYIAAIEALLMHLKETSKKQMQQAVEICTTTIENKRVVNLFGAGHSALPCMEAFPRIGSFVGFHQITEPILGFNGFVVGKGGQRQMSFIEQTTGYAAQIFKNYRFTDKDSLIIFSHSGINALPVEMAEEAQRIGMSTIGVMSLAHAQSQISKAPSGKRLDEVVSCVIDTTVPAHDAVVDIGDGVLSGGASTVISMIIMNTIVTECAFALKKRGYPLVMYPSHNVSHDLETMLDQEEAVFAHYKNLISQL